MLQEWEGRACVLHEGWSPLSQEGRTVCSWGSETGISSSVYVRARMVGI